MLARPTSLVYRLRKFTGKHRVAVAAATVILISVVGALAVSSLMYFRAESARKHSERQSYATVLAAVDAQIHAVEAQDTNERATIGSPVVWAHEAERRLTEIPTEYRGWEWRYLVARLDGSIGTLWGATASAAVAPQTVGPADSSTIPYYLGPIRLSQNEEAVFRATTQGVHRWDLKTREFTGAWSGHGLVHALGHDGSLLLSMDERLPRPWRVLFTESGETRTILDESSAAPRS